MSGTCPLHSPRQNRRSSAQDDDNHDSNGSPMVAERSPLSQLVTSQQVAALIVMPASVQAALVTGAHSDINRGFYLG